ncbi:MAG: D-alanyl-D-alanine carboxypeptidase [Clostridia bacterium]|nr:D-alanyl-D-alanine carboxypeptidase [Clostridia bacterium]
MRKNIYRKRKKKPILLILLACLLAIALAIGVVLWGLSHRDTPPDSGSTGDVSAESVTTTRRTLPVSFIDNNTFSPYVILYDATEEEVLYQKQADVKCYPASLTKLMTAIVAVEHAAADTVFTVGDEVHMIDPGSSRAYLTVGTRLSLSHLLQALLLPSGNDAAYVAAVGVGRLIAGNETLSNSEALALFVKKMNEKAAALGCKGTHFANPDGIHRDDHYTTAADMLKISVAALDYPLIAETVRMPESHVTLLSGQTVNWHNTNKLVQTDTIYTYDGIIGLKTGSTDQAGYCLAAGATRDGKTSLVIVMGAGQESNRFDDSAGLLDLSFQ